MNFENLSEKWQKESVPSELVTVTLSEVNNLNADLKKENIKLTYLMAGTIYLTGLVVFPMLESNMLMLIMGGLWFVIGIQSILFWMRQQEADKSIMRYPKRFIKAQILKLKYNLLVTNVFMPLYMLALGVLSSFYIHFILIDVITWVRVVAISLTWLSFIIIFLIVWKKQRIMDKRVINPKIKNLNILLDAYC